MPTLTLKRDQFTKLHNFCQQHKQKQFFLAKDQGAYVGSSAGDKGNCIFYFKGCNPEKDQDWYEQARHLFARDDFGEYFDAAILGKAVQHPQVNKMKFTVSKTMITVECLR